MFLVLCMALPPVTGAVVDEFDPGVGFAGHWGFDLAAAAGSEVRAPVEGRVTFAGQVAGMQSVTILTGGDVRVSLSYLSSVEVAVGDWVTVGTAVGRTGRAHGGESLHMSVRVGTSYVDPADYLHCESGTIRLLPDR